MNHWKKIGGNIKKLEEIGKNWRKLKKNWRKFDDIFDNLIDMNRNMN